jgi:hypothetical protein
MTTTKTKPRQDGSASISEILACGYPANWDSDNARSRAVGHSPDLKAAVGTWLVRS